jgi:Cytochrome P450
VIVPIHVADRDPESFTAPDDLDLNRANARRHIAFGHGIHQCPGQPLARAELRIVLPKIFLRLPDLRIAVPMDEIIFKQDISPAPGAPTGCPCAPRPLSTHLAWTPVTAARPSPCMSPRAPCCSPTVRRCRTAD